MRAMSESPQTSTFILRLTQDAAGGVTGVVERVRTGAKHRFESREALCRLLRDLLANEEGCQP